MANNRYRGHHPAKSESNQWTGRTTRRDPEHRGINQGGAHIALTQQLLHRADVRHAARLRILTSTECSSNSNSAGGLPFSANSACARIRLSARQHQTTGLRTVELVQFWVGSFKPCAASCFLASLEASFRAWATLSCIVAGRGSVVPFTGRAVLD